VHYIKKIYKKIKRLDGERVRRNLNSPHHYHHFLSLIKLNQIFYIFNLIMIKLDDYTIPSDQMMPDHITRVGSIYNL